MTTFFATAAPGLETFTAQELRSLGLLSSAPGDDEAVEPGGVTFQGGLADLYRANLRLRTAGRVLVRLGDFHAETFPELRKKASRLEWNRYLAPGQPVSLAVTCHKSRLYHSNAVAERVLAAIGDRLGKLPPVIKAAEDDPSSPAQRVVVRFANDECTISVDSSGDLLHRRGYRLASAKAPLRENLAAVMLLASGWDTTAPLLDPFCGSGTIPIEAALLARNVPPGSDRRFAFMDWPGYDARAWEAQRSMARAAAAANPTALPILQASDRDAGAVRMAQANAERAGVADCIEFACRAVSAIQPPPGPGWLVTNPPYGQRVSEGKDLRNLYAQLGNVLRAECPGWHVAILCSDPRLLGQTGLRLDTRLAFSNGGINVRLGLGAATA